MKKIFVILITLTSFNYVLSQDASKIIENAENILKGTNSAHGVSEMIVTTPDYERSLKMESWWVGNSKALIVIKSPRREKGNKTLKIKNEMWNYLKNTETTIKIPPSMMLQSWNGSDFTNDDLVRESNMKRDYHHKILGEETVDGELCWKIELIPTPEAAVVWGKIIYFVHKSDYIPERVEYFDEKDNLKRFMEFDEIKNFSGRKMPSIWRMVNKAKEGHSTTLKTLSMEFDKNIKERIFSFQELERGN